MKANSKELQGFTRTKKMAKISDHDVQTSLQFAAPSAAKLPRGHGLHVARVTAPIAVENVPNGHFRHVGALINGEYLPPVHWKQLLPYVPLGQCDVVLPALGGDVVTSAATHSYTDAAPVPVL
jgi:hypothetical protein